MFENFYKLFLNSSRFPGINVPRSRFLPVKKTDDLVLVMSNLYHLSAGTLVMNPLRSFPTTPLIKLGPGHFAKVKVMFRDEPPQVLSHTFPISHTCIYNPSPFLKLWPGDLAKVKVTSIACRSF